MPVAAVSDLGIPAANGLYTNLGLLVSDQCQHSSKLAVFQGTDKLLFKELLCGSPCSAEP